jgi:glycosyltransferase involved in cell wall biosynthesis
MKATVCVCTYGMETVGQEWMDRGNAVMQRLMQEQGAECHYVRWHSEGTLAGARNGAAVHASQAYPDTTHLIYCDADDVLAPGYVWAMMEADRDADLGFIASADDPNATQPPRIFYPRVAYVIDGQPEQPRDLCDGRDLLDINCYVIGSATPLDLFLRVGGFRPDIPIYEDWELFLRCQRAGVEFVSAPGAVYVAYDSPHSRNKQSPGLTHQWYQVIRREEIAARARGVSPFLQDQTA